MSILADTIPIEPVKVGEVYQVGTLAELRWITENESSWASEFTITANIDASDTETWNPLKDIPIDISDYAGFAPIGNEQTKFTGSFSNPGAVQISNLYINRSDRFVGFFGLVSHATIDSLQLSSVDIYGSYYAAALAGASEASFFSNCSSSGSVEATYNLAGGLIAYFSAGMIINSFSDCKVSCATMAGGLVGFAKIAKIRNTYSSGEVSAGDYAGGLVGRSIGTSYVNSYSSGNLVDLSLNESVIKGGFIAYYESGIIRNCFFDKEVSALDLNQGIGNIEITNSLAGLDSVMMKLGVTYTDANWDFVDVWSIAGGYPTLNFIADQELLDFGSFVTVGLVSTVDVDESVVNRVNEELNAFTRRATFYSKYLSPQKQNGYFKQIKALLKYTGSPSSATPEATASVLWKKKVRIYDQKVLVKGYKEGKKLKVLDLEQKPLDMSLFCKTREAGTLYHLPIQEIYFFVAPTISEALNTDDSPITVVNPGDQFKIKGDYFGSKVPKIWLEYIGSRGSIRKVKCKVLTPYKYMDYRGELNRSVMEITSGESELIIQLPSKWPGDWVPDNYDLVLSNGVGLSTIELLP